jgi:hypothetical protein
MTMYETVVFLVTSELQLCDYKIHTDVSSTLNSWTQESFTIGTLFNV